MKCSRCNQPSSRLAYRSDGGQTVKVCDKCLYPRFELIDFEPQELFDWMKFIRDLEREIIMKHLGFKEVNNEP